MKTKKLLSIALALCMLFSVVPMMSFTASAENPEAGFAVEKTFTYEYEGQTLLYTVLTEIGSTGTVSVACNSTPITGAVVIPSQVTNGGVTYAVTEIKYNSFSNHTNLTSVTIPNSVETIGHRAFYNCTNLTSVTIPNSVKKIKNSAFEGCTKLTSVTIGNSVETIGDSAFEDCDLTSVIIPDSVKSIGESAFSGCDRLSFNVYDNAKYLGNNDNPYLALISANDKNITSCTINSATRIICDSAFGGCGLTSVTIPNSVETIGDYAFEGCTNLTTVTIGNSVKTIGEGAFYDCTNLTSVTIGNSVKTIGSEAFNTMSISDVVFEGEVPSICVDSFDDIYYSIVDETDTSGVSVEIVGFKNGKTCEEERYWMGELLKPVVTGYDGDEPLYFCFNPNYYDYNDITFYTSDTSKQFNGEYPGFYKNEAYAALNFYSENFDELTCSVYTMKANGDGTYTPTLLAEKTQDLGCIYNPDTSIENEFTTKNVLVMEQGESTNLKTILSRAGFTHITCGCNHFSNVKTEKYNGNDLTINEFSDGTENTLITASTTKVGLSKITFDFYSVSCTYHGTSYSEASPYHATMYIYVVGSPEISATSSTITVEDNTVSPEVSEYYLYLDTYGTKDGENVTFTGLDSNTEYDIQQLLRVEVNGEEATGIYHHYIKTLPAYTITNQSIESYKATNYGYIITVPSGAAEGEKVSVVVSPNDGYGVNEVYYRDSSGAHKITPVNGEYSFTMPAEDVSVRANCKSLPTPMLGVNYFASLTLFDDVSINFTMKNLGTGFNIDLLKVYVDGEKIDMAIDKNGNAVGILKSVVPKDISKTLRVIVTYDGVVAKDFNYSVRNYCDAVFKAYASADKNTTNGKLYTLCEAVVNYGKWAEDYYNEKSNIKVKASKVNKGYSIDFTDASKDVPTSAPAGFTASDVVTKAGGNLNLDSKIALIINLNTTKTLTNGNVKILNDLGQKVLPENIVITETTGTYNYEIKIINIDASKLPKNYTLTIDGVDSSKFSITYGVYSYCYSANQQPTSKIYTTTLKNLGKAIYYYGNAANAYSASVKSK